MIQAFFPLLQTNGETVNRADAGAGLLLLIVGFVIYFIPAIVARDKPQANSVLALNFFLGWTFVGWVVALAWALKNPEPARVIQAIQPSPQLAPPPAVLCSSCGKYSPAGGKFCSSCGAALMA